MRLFPALVGFLLFTFSCSVYGQTSGDYRSFATGNWGTAGSWETFNGAAWVAAGASPTSANGVITIRNGHIITVAANVTIDQTVIQSGGTVVINGGGVILTLANGAGSEIDVNSGGVLTINGTLAFTASAPFRTVLVNGTMNNSGSLTNVLASKLSFGSGSNYFHQFANGGTIPAAVWNANSAMNIVGYTSGNSTAPSGLGQTFGHFVWNAPGQDVTISLGGLPTAVNGDFRVVSTGTDALYYSNTAIAGTTMSIGGNFDISGGTLVWSSGNTSASTINISGNMSIADISADAFFQFADDQNLTVNLTGNFSLSGTNAFAEFSVGLATADLNIQGNFTFSGGDIYVDGGAGSINFTGASTKTYTSTIAPTGNLNYTVASLSTLNVSGSNFVGGGGTFNLSGTLQIGSTDSGGALQTGTAAGNIRVAGTRTYSSNSNITYNGSGAQFIGNGFPSGSNVNLTINNSSGVTLSTSLSIVALQVLTLTSGNISIGAQTLTINGSVSGAGGIVGGATSNLTIGGTGDFGTLTFSGTNQLLNFTLNRTSSGLVTLGGSLTILGTFTHTAGVLAIGNNNTLTLSGAWGPSNPDDLSVTNSSSIVVSGSGSVPSDFGFDAGSSALGTLTMNRASTTLTTSSSITITNLNLTSGTFSNGSGITIATGGTITRAGGSMSSNPTNTNNSYNVVYTSGTITTGPELPSNTTALANLSKTGSGTLTLGSNITVNGVFTLSSGSFNAGSNSMDLKGNFASNAASTLTSSAITFSGTTALSGSSTPVFGAITISGSLTPSSSFQVNGNLVNNGTLNAGSATTTFGGTTTISGSSTSSFNNVTISGTLTAPSGTMNVAGNFANNGTFSHNNGSVTFNGTTSISGSSTTSLFGVTVSGTLTAPSTTINIAGNWTTTGTFTHNSGKVVLNGTVSAQSITGTISMNDVDVSNPIKVNNNGTFNLNGVLTLVSSGKFDADGAGSGVLTIKSTSVSAGGRIAALATPANFSGLVTVERFINGPDDWRYLSMPLTNGNVGTWQANFPVTGNFSDSSPNGVNGVVDNTAASIYYYDGATQAYVAVGSGASTSSTPLSNLTGYSAYSYISTDFTASTRGSVLTGNATVPISTSGYNLVPNPYPSPVDWDNMNRTGLSSTMSIRIDNNVFASYVAGGLATNPPFVNWTGEVAIGQSFWIQSSGASSLNLTESAKTSNAYQFLRQAAPRNFVRIVLTSKNQRDETLVWFNENATTGFDSEYDAIKMRNGYFVPNQVRNSYLNLSTYLEDSTTEYAINSISKLKCNNAIGMKVTDVNPGQYTLSFEDLETMDLGYKVILVDHFTKTEKEVDSNLKYAFIVTNDKATYGNSRFELRFLLSGSAWINSVKPPQTTITEPCNFKNLGISVDSQIGATYQFFKDSSPVTDVLTGSGSALKVIISKSLLSIGNNDLGLRVMTQIGCDSYSFNKAIVYDYRELAPVEITKEGLLLKSSAKDGNQWFENGVAIEGANYESYEVKESATYTVKVSNGGCMVSSDLVVDLVTDVIQVFPVPTDGKVNLILPDAINKSLVSLSLYDIRGLNLLDEHSNQELLSHEVKTLDVSNLESGVYILHIKADKIYPIKIIRK